MDTSSFDKKMEDCRKQAIVGVPFPSAGIKPILDGGGKVVSLAKEPIPLGPQAGLVYLEQGVVVELKKQLAAVLEDNHKLTDEIARLEARVQKVARLTDNDKLSIFIRKYDELKTAYDEIKFRMAGLEQ